MDSAVHVQQIGVQRLRSLIKAPRNLILLSYDIGLIDGKDFILLYSSNLSAAFRTAYDFNHKAFLYMTVQ